MTEAIIVLKGEYAGIHHIIDIIEFSLEKHRLDWEVVCTDCTHDVKRYLEQYGTPINESEIFTAHQCDYISLLFQPYNCDNVKLFVCCSPLEIISNSGRISKGSDFPEQILPKAPKLYLHFPNGFDAFNMPSSEIIERDFRNKKYHLPHDDSSIFEHCIPIAGRNGEILKKVSDFGLGLLVDELLKNNMEISREVYYNILNRTENQVTEWRNTKHSLSQRNDDY